MMRFVVVGCGGSGGVTVQYLMDQLRADLHRLGVDRLPRGWQFLHVDVPVTSDGGGPGRPPVVGPPDGAYVPLSYQGASYPTIYASLAGPLQGRPDAMGHLSPWVPDPAAAGNVPIMIGAGQYRAVGRTLTLPQTRRIAAALKAAFEATGGAAVDAELLEIRRRVAPRAGAQIPPVPVVLVVSSMAGGAGASMVLDVCRLVAGTANQVSNTTGLFLYTPEVFRGLRDDQRRGVDANGLAMSGELLAAQLGAGRADADLLRALGWTPAYQADVPFKRVFPIGSRVGGDGGEFGDGTADGVYRATGRGLAALMLSDSALTEFVSFDLGNSTALDTDDRSLGWGAPADAIQWGSFGFASIGLGRERYAEYAAQRLARVAVDRLVEGHVALGDTRTGTEQLAARTQARWPVFRDYAELPPGVGDQDLWTGFVARVATTDAARTRALAAFDAVMGPWLPSRGPVPVGQFTETWRARLRDHQQQLAAQLADEAYRMVHAWHHGLRDRVESAVVEEAAGSGLPAVHELLARASAEAPAWVAGLRQLALRGPADVTNPGEVWKQLSSHHPEAQIEGGHPLLAQLRRGHADTMALVLQAQAAGLLADVLLSARDEFFGPLAARVQQVHAELETARRSTASDQGLARTATDQYPAWPSGTGSVPARFSSAHNEVLLTPADRFEGLFTAHLQGGAPGGGWQDGLGAAVGAILRGRWEASGGAVDRREVLVRTAGWRPAALPTDPDDGTRTAHPPQWADYTLAHRPRDVLARARDWLARPLQPFSRFVDQSLYTYLEDRAVGDDERAQRADGLRSRFSEALKLARPLVAVNTATFLAVHRQDLVEHFKFSEVPFAGMPIADAIAADIDADPRVAAQTSARFLGAAIPGGSSRATRIDVFGAYSPAAPVVFTSLMGPIAARWTASLDPTARSTFWRWRRARRLPGALPCTDAARRAMVQGFFVGRLVGAIRLPGESFGGAAEIWDADARAWLAFPDPLLTAREAQRDQLDMLPAVLESMLLAVAACHSAPDLAPLRPYRLLRELCDDGSQPFQGWDPTQRAAVRHLQAWVSTGLGAGGNAPDPDRAGPASGSAKERKAAMLEYLGNLAATVGQDWMFPGDHGAPGGGRFSRVELAPPWTVPMFREVAADAYDAARELGAVVEALSTDDLPPPGQKVKL